MQANSSDADALVVQKVSASIANIIIAAGQGDSEPPKQLENLEKVIDNLATAVTNASAGSLNLADTATITTIVDGAIDIDVITQLSAINENIRSASNLDDIVAEQTSVQGGLQAEAVPGPFEIKLESQNGNDVTFGIYVNEDFLPVLSDLDGNNVDRDGKYDVDGDSDAANDIPGLQDIFTKVIFDPSQITIASKDDFTVSDGQPWEGGAVLIQDDSIDGFILQAYWDSNGASDVNAAIADANAGDQVFVDLAAANPSLAEVYLNLVSPEFPRASIYEAADVDFTNAWFEFDATLAENVELVELDLIDTTFDGIEMVERRLFDFSSHTYLVAF